MIRLSPVFLISLPLVLAACDRADTGRTGGAAYQGGDLVADADGSAMSPSAQALSDRFGLAEADLIISPTTYRAQGDLSAGAGINVAVIEDADPGYIRVSGSADPQAVLDDPGLGLSYSLSPDRTRAYAGQSVIVTAVVRSPEAIEEDARPAVRAAWVGGGGQTSGWQDMALTEEWQKAVFTHDVPEDLAADVAHIVMLPPEGGTFEMAALSVRTGLGEPASPGDGG